jgi:hypothetical protein
MRRREREKIMSQGAVGIETPRQRREHEALQQDVESSGLAGRRVEQRLRNFRPDAASYFAALGGPRPYMTRLRMIHVQTRRHELQLEAAWRELADETAGDAGLFERRWRETAERWSVFEVNELIARHNRWFPVESRLPMDPRRRDYALVNGEDYRLRPLDSQWVLERYPPRPPLAEAV